MIGLSVCTISKDKACLGKFPDKHVPVVHLPLTVDAPRLLSVSGNPAKLLLALARVHSCIICSG